MTEEEMQFVAREMLFVFWGIENEEVPQISKKRFRKKVGLFDCYIEEDKNGELKVISPKIYISDDVVDYGSNFLIKEVIKHEICHYAMLIKGMPYIDGDSFFESELERIHAFSSKKLDFYFLVNCPTCLSTSSFPKRSEAKTFFRKKCSCGGKNKTMKFYAQDNLFE